ATASVESGSFFRLVMPAFPAFAALVACVPLAAPVFGNVRVQRRPTPTTSARERRLVVAGAALLVVAPMLLIAAASHAPRGSAMRYMEKGVYVPVTKTMHVAAVGRKRKASLTWGVPRRGRSQIFYHVFRAPAGKFLSCDRPTIGTVDCVLSGSATEIGT